jgi:hypothetical protein
MGKHRGRFQNQNNKQRIINPDAEINTIRNQQQHQHQQSQNHAERYRRHPPKMQVVVLLENGTSFSGTAVRFSNPKMPQCKIFFKNENRQEFDIAIDVNIQTPSPEKIAVLQTIINNHLIALHKEAVMEFPEWLEKHSIRVNENNPYFNLDEIREEFKFKKVRFGIWRIAAQLGFFDDMKPQFAKFNKVVHLELREPELDRFN